MLLTGGTMLLSVFAYALVFGWRYAAGFVGLIFVHEMGHYLAARQRGLDVYSPSPMLILMVVLAAPQLIKALKYDPMAPENQAYYGVKPGARLAYGLYYLLLAGFLAIMTHDVHEMLGDLHSKGQREGL